MDVIKQTLLLFIHSKWIMCPDHRLPSPPAQQTGTAAAAGRATGQGDGGKRGFVGWRARGRLMLDQGGKDGGNKRSEEDKGFGSEFSRRNTEEVEKTEVLAWGQANSQEEAIVSNPVLLPLPDELQDKVMGGKRVARERKANARYCGPEWAV
ncbi:hypothetical protein GUJ93_ZPchr0009g1367 [Zizania palustris]|uniref:Uncharacterized protein n=1 Tax=Zizania palustris TaxID=103762 RepID=A0A8J5RNS4_ZIZPA|nr:hypothetical protein GUJ93_ZPchr0009g1367 [Zizania palustris]